MFGQARRLSSSNLEPPQGVTLVKRLSFGAWMEAWSCDGRYLATVGRDGCDVWQVDPATWKHQHMFVIKGGGDYGDSRFVQWSPVDPDLLVQAWGDTLSLLRIKPGGRGCTELWRAGYPPRRRLLPAVGFAPDGRHIAIVDGGSTIKLVNLEDPTIVDEFETGMRPSMLSWSPEGDQIMVYGESFGATIVPLDRNRRNLSLANTAYEISWASWSADGETVCTTAGDHTIRVWDRTGALRTVVEGHTDEIWAIEFDRSGRLLYSAGDDQTLRCWRTDTWECVATIPIRQPHREPGGLAVHPTMPMLARRAIGEWGIDLYRIDVDSLIARPALTSVTYANAKVVLLGDTGVGKSGLSLALTGRPFVATDSTHGREVWALDTSIGERNGRPERRDTLLWDLAGQPGYRLIHQLHLGEVAAAVVVFDSRNEVDPFAGVRYWVRALRQHSPNRRVPVVLVAARIDRGGVPASRDRVEALCAELQIDQYIETSAKEGSQIEELGILLRDAIQWQALPWTSSNDLFDMVKRFIVEETDGESVLAFVDDVFRAFQKRHAALSADSDLRATFDTCIRQLANAGLVRRLPFGDYLLLRPELMDGYASALITAAREQPDGLGSFPEDRALRGDFTIPADARLSGTEEQPLLLATVQELLQHELALREPGEGGVDLVFPSQLTATQPEQPDPPAADLRFLFDGDVMSVYATLVVRLSRLPTYEGRKMWRDSCTFRLARSPGQCGLRVRRIDEGRGELAVFFEQDTALPGRVLFEEYVQTHLMTHALPGSVISERVLRCPRCGYRMPPELAKRKIDRGETTAVCADCEQDRIDLVGASKRQESRVHVLNAHADAARDGAAATATVRGKEKYADFDLFVSYDSSDWPAVEAIAGEMRKFGLLPWLSNIHMPPGRKWQEVLVESIQRVNTGVIFLGRRGLSDWQGYEQRFMVDENAHRPDFRILPVVLPDVPADVVFPPLIRQWQQVRLRSLRDKEAISALIRAINLDKPSREAYKAV
jgi:small GTP-binding protein